MDFEIFIVQCSCGNIFQFEKPHAVCRGSDSEGSSVSAGIVLCLRVGFALADRRWANGLLVSLSCIFQMDTTQESYLDLFPLDAIVYLTPDSENGKYFTHFRHVGSNEKGAFLSFSF